MNVLVACEYSGRVRDAFTARGHYAVSADLLASDTPGMHYRGDVLDVLDMGWDMMIAHPPCTYLSNSGVRWLSTQEGRWVLMQQGAEFFRALLQAPIDRIAVENPIMHRYASDIIGRRQDQIIQPWQYGHTETKATCLWLDGLEPLTPTDDVSDLMADMAKRDTDRVHYMSPGPERAKLRSLTYQGIADAMAEQWGLDA